METRRENLLLQALAIGLALALVSCGAKPSGGDLAKARFETPEDELPELPESPVEPDDLEDLIEEPEEILPRIVEGGVLSGKTYYQTRDVIALPMSREMLLDAQTMTLINETTGATLIDDKPLVSDLALWSDDEAEFGLADESFQVVVQVFPTDRSMRAGMNYGKNVMKLIVDDGYGPKESEVELTLRDFPVFGQATTAFTKNRQVIGGFQAWVNPVQGKAMSPDGAKLKLGMLNIVNP
jgi:hypothetical protein